MLNWFSASSSSDSVVITGASSGIGAACALALDKLGYRVFAGIRTPLTASVLSSRPVRA